MSQITSRRNKRTRTAILAAAVAGVGLWAGSAGAATQTWNVQMSGGPHDWNTATNWTTAVPVAGDTANVNENYTTGGLNINISANSSLNTLTLGDSMTTASGGTDFVGISLSGSPLKFENLGPVAAAGTINSSRGANSIGNNLIMSLATGTGLTINGLSGTLTISGDIQGASNVVIGGNNNAVWNNRDGGAAGGWYNYLVTRLAPIVADMNPGIVVFSGAKTFTGNLTINANATLVVDSAAAMGSNAGPAPYITVTGALADGFAAGMAATDLAKIVTTSAGALAITGNSATSYDFATPGLNSLTLGSTVLGSAAVGGATYSGTLTPGTGGYLLGGGGVATKLILANGAISGTTGATVSGNGIVQFGDAAVGYTGAIAATGGTAYINGVDLKGAASLTTTGTTPTAGGAVLLGAAWTNGPASVTLNNGAIGWDANKTITGLPGTYSATTVAGTAGVATVKLLNLGGTHSVGTMSQDGSYALQDDGAQAVELVKSGVQSTLDLSSAPSGGNTFTGGVHIASGTLLFNNLNQLGPSGNIVGNNTGILKLAPNSSAVSTSRILDPLDGGGGGGGGAPLPGLAIDVTGTDRLTFTGTFENTSTNRHAIVKTGTGILEIVPSAMAATTVNTWGIGVRGGTVRLNQLPYSYNANGGSTGVLEFAATATVDLLAPPGALPTGVNLDKGYGFQQIGVYNNATGTINVAANTILKNSGRNGASSLIPAGSTLIVAGAGYANGSQFQWGRYGSGQVISATTNGGIWDLRSIAFSFLPDSQPDASMPSQTDFTLKLNDAKAIGTVYKAAFSHNGNLVINDLVSPNATLSQIDNFTVTSTGNTSWRGTLEKIGTGAYGLTFSRSGGNVTVASGAKLLISAGTVTAGGTADPFYDTVNSRGVDVENNATFNITAGSKHIASLTQTGTGNTTVSAGATLLVGSGSGDVTQNSLTLTTGTPGATLDTTGGTTGHVSITGAAVDFTVPSGATLKTKGNLSVATGRTITAAAGATQFDVGGRVTAGTFAVNENASVGAFTTVTGGAVTNIATGKTLTVKANGTSVSVTNALGIAGGGTPTGTLDITDNNMVVQPASGGGLAAKTLHEAQVKSGLNVSGGTYWAGPGINSSTAAAAAAVSDLTKGVGIILNDLAQLGNGSGTGGGAIYGTWPVGADAANAVAVNADSVLVKYTWWGDADLSGVIDSTDYFLIDYAYGLGLTGGGWLNGDFDYSGTIDSTDYFLIDNAYASQSGPLSAELISQRVAMFGQSYVASLDAAAVPEPATLGLLVLGALGLMGRRRRRS